MEMFRPHLGNYGASVTAFLSGGREDPMEEVSWMKKRDTGLSPDFGVLSWVIIRLGRPLSALLMRLCHSDETSCLLQPTFCRAAGSSDHLILHLFHRAGRKTDTESDCVHKAKPK